MKKLFLMLAVVALMSVAASAQTRKTEQLKTWKKFQTAIAKNDKAMVAAMIKYPFEVLTNGGDAERKIETKADFINNYAQIFTAARRRTIARAKYVPITDEDEFNVEMQDPMSGLHYYRFRKIGAAYFLVGTIIIGDV